MTRLSLESERPIMAPSTISSKRASKRFSTYSASPSFTSAYSANTHETGMQEIKNLTTGLDRLENKPLQSQRFVPSETKKEIMSKISLGAKVERALSRRMVDQDYVRKESVMGEKGAPAPMRKKHKDVLEVLSEKREMMAA